MHPMIKSCSFVLTLIFSYKLKKQISVTLPPYLYVAAGYTAERVAAMMLQRLEED